MVRLPPAPHLKAPKARLAGETSGRTTMMFAAIEAGEECRGVDDHHGTKGREEDTKPQLCVIPPLQLCSASCFASGFGLFRPDAGHFLTCVNGDATAARVQGVYRRLACRPSASSTTFFCWCRCWRERE
eukprot:scaffold7688_cov130-Isochrysis_galbana.AAC.15